MKFEVLHTEGCSGYQATERNLRQALGKEGLEAEVELIAVRTDEEARRLRFPGSPTVRVNGQDLFASPGNLVGEGWGLEEDDVAWYAVVHRLLMPVAEREAMSNGA